MSPVTASTKSTSCSSAGVEEAGRDSAVLLTAEFVPDPTTSNRFTPASRRQGAGLDHQRGMPIEFVPLRGVPDVAHVEMAGEKEIGADSGELFHRHRRASDEILLVKAIG